MEALRLARAFDFDKDCPIARHAPGAKASMVASVPEYRNALAEEEQNGGSVPLRRKHISAGQRIEQPIAICLRRASVKPGENGQPQLPKAGEIGIFYCRPGPRSSCLPPTDKQRIRRNSLNELATPSGRLVSARL